MKRMRKARLNEVFALCCMQNIEWYDKGRKEMYWSAENEVLHKLITKVFLRKIKKPYKLDECWAYDGKDFYIRNAGEFYRKNAK